MNSLVEISIKNKIKFEKKLLIKKTNLLMENFESSSINFTLGLAE